VHNTAARFYEAMPASIQHLLCSAEGYRLQRARFGSGFDADLREAMARTLSSKDAVCSYRDNRLAAFVRDAATASPFYRSQPQFASIAVGGAVALDQLPILTKGAVLDAASEIARHDLRAAEIAQTSGTTGAYLRFPVTADAVRQQWATWWRYRQWHGIDRGTWCGYFGGRAVVPVGQRRPPFWRYNVAGRQVFFSSYHLRPDTWRSYVAELRRHRLPWLHGYPSTFALLAAYLLEHRESLGYDVRWITVGSESLLPSQAEAIERAFGVRPRQHYGLREGAANASECPHGRLHVDEDFSFVEFVPVAHGSGYRIVGTNFTNAAFPLIRYDVGDVAQVSGQTCDCGRPGRIIDRIDGRREDYVLLPDGAVIGCVSHIIETQTRIREGQIYQPDSRNVVLRIVKGRDYTRHDEASLLREARALLGTDIHIEIDYVERVPRTAAGKLRSVISDIGAAAHGQPDFRQRLESQQAR
jgi:phenylacetate-CoA ligase